jgi:hypothetical protein
MNVNSLLLQGPQPLLHAAYVEQEPIRVDQVSYSDDELSVLIHVEI